MIFGREKPARLQITSTLYYMRRLVDCSLPLSGAKPQLDYCDMDRMKLRNDEKGPLTPTLCGAAQHLVSLSVVEEFGDLLALGQCRWPRNNVELAIAFLVSHDFFLNSGFGRSRVGLRRSRRFT